MICKAVVDLAKDPVPFGSSTRSALLNYSRLLAILACSFCLGANLVIAQADTEQANGIVKQLKDVPEPPAELSRLVERGNISFRFGGSRPSTINGMKSTGRRDQSFDAETQFRLRYEFSCRCRWWWSDDVVTIRVKYDQLRLIANHEIWMAHEPSGDFWKSRLLSHELDHVRLSSDPKLLALFEQRVLGEDELQFTVAQVREILGENAVEENILGENPTSSRRLSSADVRALVNTSVKHHFDQVVEMVDIRYTELDRVTVHGGRPVPADGELARWLGEANP